MSKISFAKPGGACGSRAARPDENSAAPMARTELPKPDQERPYLALLSSNGREIDLHLGEAIQVLIYGPDENGALNPLWIQDAPEPGGGDLRWQTLAESLSDCFALVAASAGGRPQQVLAEHGLPLLLAQGEIKAVLDELYNPAKK